MFFGTFSAQNTHIFVGKILAIMCKMRFNGRENALFSEAMCIISTFYKQDKVLLNVYSGDMSTSRRGFLKVPCPAYGTTTLRSFKLTIFRSKDDIWSEVGRPRNLPFITQHP